MEGESRQLELRRGSNKLSSSSSFSSSSSSYSYSYSYSYLKVSFYSGQKMAAESSNTGFHRDNKALASALNRQDISFESAAINNSSEMIHMGDCFGVNAAAAATSSTIMMMPGNPRMIGSSPGMVQVQPVISASSSSLVIDSIPPGLKHDTGLAVEWSVDEQLNLEEGLVKYADEPSIMRYVKIAATLRDKTVRDVALRCRWMMRKRRKAEEFNLGKMASNGKDKTVESSSKIHVTSALSQNMVGYTLMTQGEPLLFEGISGTTQHLLEQNAQVLSQITTNLSTRKLQDNIDLFCHARNNITAILNVYVNVLNFLNGLMLMIANNYSYLWSGLCCPKFYCDYCSMRGMPGIMSQMPPLPVCLDEDLASSILSDATQSAMFGSHSGIKLKQEPRC